MKEVKMGESFQTCPLSSFGFFINQKRSGGGGVQQNPPASDRANLLPSSIYQRVLGRADCQQ